MKKGFQQRKEYYQRKGGKYRNTDQDPGVLVRYKKKEKIKVEKVD